ncbi:centromere protein C isoform X2 [Punica granatum]|uniref:Centromere protein C isoform X2 n=1 Tax=Punica granatum TaxID=22663 RepID=A0A6P8CZY2_PUNGR|nr:centromere protein C isoform X2 [Punica granatum]
MASGATGPDPLDALAQFSVLSLFPRSFGALQNASDPYDLERELDSLHSHLGTIALQGPKKLFNQAKSIMESCSELLNTDIPGEVAAEERDEFDAAKANEENPKRRRPGLGLKRPKFSLKPDSSQPAVNLEATFDIDSYEDPDEFFAAFERMEQANREIMRQNGIVPEDPGQHKLKEARRRRPGLPGRSYKHKFSESGIFPPETVMESYVAVSNSTIQQDAENESNDESRERDFTGSTKAKRKHSELLDELLSLNLEDLDGDGAASLLQEHLQIKAINIENLELPDLQDIQKDDWNASVGNLSKQIPVLLDIQNLMKRAHGHSPTKHKGGSESSKNYVSSKSATKSPFAQISLLQKRLFRENSSIDPFSSDHVDDVAARNCLDMEHAEKESDDVNKRNKSDVSSHNPGDSISIPVDRGDFDVVIGSNSNDLQNEVANCKTDLPMMAEFLDRPSTDLDSQAEKEAATSTQLNAETEDSDTEEANEDGNILGLTKAKRKNNELLDELLSLNLEDLDGDGAANPLQEHLQTKAINIENLELPDLQDIQKDDLNASVGNLSKQRPVLLDIQNLMKRAHGHSPTKHKAARNCLDMEHAEKESDDVNKRNKSDGSSHNPGESISGTLDRGDFDVVIGSNSNDLQNEVTNHKTDLPMMAEFLDRPSTDLDSQAEKEAATSTQLNAETEDSDTEEANEDGDILDPLVFSIVEEFARDGSSKRPDGVLEQQIEVPHVCSQAEKEAATPTQQNAEAGDSNTEEANEDGDILVSSEVEEFARDGSSKCPGGVLEQQIEEPVATLPSGQGEKKSCPSCNGRKRKEASALRSSRESENPVATECQQNERRDDASEELIEEAAQEMHTGGRKSRPRPKKPRLVNELSRRRTSLGGAGTTWDNGVRRSTRIRSRPLAFWKGERFLYGRIHESLATVIGVKYESPGDGKPRLKVKSFVSDEYKELVELVS